MQQRLGWNAAAIEANPAETWVALDKDDFLSKVSSVKCGGVASRACADNDDFSLYWIHN
jgi:hypothetical protein